MNYEDDELLEERSFQANDDEDGETMESSEEEMKKFGEEEEGFGEESY